MLSEADRNKAADILMEAHKTANRRRSFSITFPGITIEDAYAISTDGAKRQIAAGAQADRPQGRAHLEGDAALLEDRRAGLRLSARRPDDRRRRQGAARQLLQAARRGRARLRPRQAADGPGRRPDRRAARHRIRRAGDRDRRCARAGPAQDLRHRLRQRRRRRHRHGRPSGRPDGRRPALGRRHHVQAIPRSRRPASPPACSAIRRWASPGSPTSSARIGTRARARPYRAGRLVHARGVRARRATPCTPISARSAASPCSSCRGQTCAWTCRATPSSTRIAAGQLQIGLWSQPVQQHRRRDHCRTPASTGSCSTPSIRRTKSPTCSSQLQAMQARHRDADRAPGLERHGADQALPRHRRADAAVAVRAERGGGQARGRLDALSAAGHARHHRSAARASRYGRMPGLSEEGQRAKSACWCRSRPARRSTKLEAIAAVDGVDGVFIGPSDLSASFGHIGNLQHAEVQAAMEDAVKRLKKIGKPAGILTRQRGGGPPLHRLGLSVRRGRRRRRPARPSRRRLGKKVPDKLSGGSPSAWRRGHDRRGCS